MSVGSDDIIVGAGSAGAVLAARLSEDPTRHVLLLEAGPDYSTVEQTPAPLRNGPRMPGTHDWGSTAEIVLDRSVPYTRGKVAGGSSAVASGDDRIAVVCAAAAVRVRCIRRAGRRPGARRWSNGNGVRW